MAKKTTAAAPTTVAEQLKDAFKLRPTNFKMEDLIWRYVIRSVMRGDTMLLRGPSGCGKTKTAYAAAAALQRQLFVFNMGATQDSRGALIGNTHYDPARGTYVAESEFLRAIQTPNAIILLDEISRAHPDASNILMTVLDKEQRYLRLDEKPGAPMVHVHPSVCFFLTANVGAEYTGTRTIDRALYDRAKIIDVEPLSADEEYNLLAERYTDVDKDILRAVADIAGETRLEVKADSPKVETIISTRVTLEIAELLRDGFSLEEAAKICIYPLYSDDGGLESARSHVLKLVQKYVSMTPSGASPVTQGGDDSPPW